MERYYHDLATAFVRGRVRDQFATIEDGLQAGLRLHKFKVGPPLPRIQKVLGILRSLAPVDLLDVGSGRGAFLWPLLAVFPGLSVTAIDFNEQRASDLGAVRRGGCTRLTPVRMDAQRLGFAPRSFDAVTMLEVLEHMPNPQAALTAAVAVARRCVILSVPSVPDDNPEHLHLFTPDQLQRMAAEAGGARITVEHVLNHRVAVIRVAS
ncbi:class I SAM-dependent methyltransferase [Paludibaculum fermentans]|uniref:class I SAM-dependent methyltransferase n=1 Tax=Paludibaculum fermentans TaxID=1473598 RepID=UPI003EBD48A0